MRHKLCRSFHPWCPGVFYMKCFSRAALCILNGDASLRILSTDASGCFFTNVTFTAVAEISIRGDFFFQKAIINSLSLTCFSFISFYSELTSLGEIKITKSGRYFHCGLVHLASLRWNSPKIFHTVFETLPVGAKSLPILTPDYWHPPQSNFTEYKQDMVAVFYAPVNGQLVN